MGVASGCGEQEVGVASGSGWNLWVWLLGVVLRRYIDFLILLIPTPLVSVLFCSSIPTFLFIFYIYIYIIILVGCKHRASEVLLYIGGRGLVSQIIELVTFARCAFIIALRNIALDGYLDTRRNI